jgi:hypothetical protein
MRREEKRRDQTRPEQTNDTTAGELVTCVLADFE